MDTAVSESESETNALAMPLTIAPCDVWPRAGLALDAHAIRTMTNTGRVGGRTVGRMTVI
jgi:hypothetical protein